MSGSEIIESILNELGLKAPTFASNIEVKYQRIFDIQNGKTKKVSGELAKKIVGRYPQFSLSWILTGEGSMLKSTPKNEAELLEVFHIRYVPIVSQYAYAGYLAGYSDPEYIETLPTSPFVFDHDGKGNYLVFIAKGDSMSDGSQDSILDGDELLCREIQADLWISSKLHLKRWSNYVIVHKTEGILIKQIVEHDVENGVITIHSLNSMYLDREIKLQEVAQIFNVIKTARNLK